MRYLRCQSSFLYYARAICIIRMTAVFAFAHYAPVFRSAMHTTSFHEVQFLRIIASMHDLMRSILPHKTEYCIYARISLFRNWRRSSGWKCYEFQRVESLNRCDDIDFGKILILFKYNLHYS